ncbi:MAG: formyltransferase family protein [Patescibacteria group bacterium]|jgi:phosphoribosylglycinamide formyltransferase-1
MFLSKLLFFASGSREGGGSGFEVLVIQSCLGNLQAEIVGVVSNHANGGVFRRAQKHGIPFRLMNKPYGPADYQRLIDEFQPDLICLSGWLRLFPAECLGKIAVINIHPGPLPRFGGSGMHGHHVHEEVLRAFKQGEIDQSCVTMHFVNSEYDQGQIFFELPVYIDSDDTPETLGARVNEFEHGWQWWATNLVATEQIRMENGRLIVPDWYTFLPKE